MTTAALVIVACAAGICRLYRGCGSSTSQRTGNGTHGDTNHHTHRAAHDATNGGARGRTGYQAASGQHGLGFALSFLRVQLNLRRRVWVL